MSLLIPKPMEERASVILPTVTCSTCSAPIPLSSLGEHICRAPPVPSSNAYARNGGPSSYASAGPSVSQPRQVTRPQLTIPLDPPRPTHANSFSSSPLSGSPGSFNRPFARSPLGSAGSSPAGSYNSQLGPSPSNLHPPTLGGQRTPSPTNPFFPQHRTSPERKGSFGDSVAKGPFPTDAPLPPGVHGLQENGMPDMMSGGNAGMAGVGRRAFAAAAWGVRAGVALAQGVAAGQAQAQQPPSAQQQQPGRRSSPTESSTSFPQAHTHQPRVTSPTPSDASSSYPRPAYPGQRSGSPSTREPPLLPKVSLKDRPRANGGPPSRSNSYETEDDTLKRKPSDTKQFFDRYKAMVASSSSADSPPLGYGNSAARASPDLRASERKPSYSRLDDDDDDLPSALPWAVPSGDSPDIGLLNLSDKVKIPSIPPAATNNGALGRHKTGQSSSSNSSGTSGRSGRSAPDQEVVTPSQSWEGFADRRAEYKQDPVMSYGKGSGNGAVGLGFGIEERDHLEQIREDEEEQVVFGARLAVGMGSGMKPSTSDSSISTGASDSNPYRAHSRAQTAPEHHGAPLSHSGHGLSRRPSADEYAAPATSSHSSSRSHTHPHVNPLGASASSSTSSRRAKVCAKCSEPVGGAKRFVERDGVVLCERDWKKLYLPSCRKCRLPIEKSAVSSSDGQLKGKWHRACFACTRCDKGFETDDFYVLDGRPWCQYHYHEENGTLCAAPSCRQPIEGQCLLLPSSSSSPTGEPERFHPGHLRCDGGDGRCRDRMEEYYQVGRGRYCESHVQAALRKQGQVGQRAEKRRTRMVDLSAAGGLSLR